MKRFFYFSVSFLCLALAALIGFHIGSRSVEAQSAGLSIAGFTQDDHFYVILSNGDVYSDNLPGSGDPIYRGNFFGDNPPVNASESTWGDVKNQFKK